MTKHYHRCYPFSHPPGLETWLPHNAPCEEEDCLPPRFSGGTICDKHYKLVAAAFGRLWTDEDDAGTTTVAS